MKDGEVGLRVDGGIVARDRLVMGLDERCAT